jgi:hypothetical protein
MNKLNSVSQQHIWSKLNLMMKQDVKNEYIKPVFKPRYVRRSIKDNKFINAPKMVG